MSYSIPQRFREKDILVNGKTIHYGVTGSGPVLVFIHGWSSNWYGWIPLAQVLQKHFTLYMPDLLGYGKSGKLTRYSIDIQAKYIADFIATLKIKPQAIVSASMGTFIAAVLLKKYPRVITHAIMLGLVITSKRNQLVKNFVGDMLSFIQNKPLIESIPKHFLATRRGAHMVAKYLHRYHASKDLIDQYNIPGKREMQPDAYVDMGVSVHFAEIEKLLQDCKQSILFLNGERDIISSHQEMLDAFGERLQYCFEEVADAGHIVALEQPQAVADSIYRFLSTTKTRKRTKQINGKLLKNKK